MRIIKTHSINDNVFVERYKGKKIYKSILCDRTMFYYWFDNENNYFPTLDSAENAIDRFNRVRTAVNHKTAKRYK